MASANPAEDGLSAGHPEPDLVERPTTQRRIDWMKQHDDDWSAAIARGDRAQAQQLYEEFGELLRAEMDDEGGSPVLSLPHTNELLRRRVQAFAGRRALDIGCGPTPVAAMALRDAGVAVVGVDVAGSILSIARRVAGPGISFTKADAELLPFADRAFDVITCDDTLEHCFDQEAMVRSAARTLVPGGRMLVVTPNASGFHVKWAKLHELLRGRRHPREWYHMTQAHTRELRWRELHDLFKPWFVVREVVPIRPEAPKGVVLKLIDRFLGLPGMARFGMVHFIEFERRAS